MNNQIPFQIPEAMQTPITETKEVTSPLTLAECKAKFIYNCLKVSKRSPHTAQSYAGEIDRFAHALPQGLLTPISDVTVEQVKSYIAYANTEKRKWEDHPFNSHSSVQQVGLKGTTVNNMRRYLSAFFNWLVSENIMTENPVKKIRKVTEDKVSYDDIIELFEIKQLMQQINRDTYSGYVDAAIIQVLVDTAMRIGQLLQLEVRDLMLEQRLIHIRPEISKTHQEHWVPITEDTANMLKNIVKAIARVTQQGVPWLWLTDAATHLSYSTISDRLKHYASLAGIEARRVRPHQFRHFSAIQHRKNGASIDEIQILLEHKDIRTTMLYLQRFKHDLRAINDRYSPAHDLLKKPGRRVGSRTLTLCHDVEVENVSHAS